MPTRWPTCSAPICKGMGEAETAGAFDADLAVVGVRYPMTREGSGWMLQLPAKMPSSKSTGPNMPNKAGPKVLRYKATRRITCRFPQRSVLRRWPPLLPGHLFRQFSKKLVVAGVGLDEIDGKRHSTAAFDAVDVDLPLFTPLPDASVTVVISQSSSGIWHKGTAVPP